MNDITQTKFVTYIFPIVHSHTWAYTLQSIWYFIGFFLSFGILHEHTCVHSLLGREGAEFSFRLRVFYGFFVFRIATVQRTCVSEVNLGPRDGRPLSSAVVRDSEPARAKFDSLWTRFRLFFFLSLFFKFKIE